MRGTFPLRNFPVLSSPWLNKFLTLSVLSEAGIVQIRDEIYRKEVKFLLNTQAEGGSWHVASRAAKFQPYFESGFPYGHDQWISQMGTAWAANALALAPDAPAGAAKSSGKFT